MGKITRKNFLKGMFGSALAITASSKPLAKIIDQAAPKAKKISDVPLVAPAQTYDDWCNVKDELTPMHPWFGSSNIDESELISSATNNAMRRFREDLEKTMINSLDNGLSPVVKKFITDSRAINPIKGVE